MNKKIKMSHKSPSLACIHLQSANLRPVSGTHHVYKDECCTCFYNQDSEEGIDVCLTCFQAGCLETDRNHALEHYKSHQDHPIVLNIRRKKLKEEPSADSKTAAMTKLEIPAESDSDQYEYHTTPKCYTCQTQLEPDQGNLGEVIGSVMNSLSSAQQTEVKAWEQDMIACVHTKTLQQEAARQLQDQNLATCSECELSQNLWLCLVCGTLSCGRSQFGGGGGNGHGLQHVQASGHSVAVKLGSITPEGTADIYCYACDEERIDPLLQEHLAHWGIILGERTKTEKSLQELQIEQNMKWEFSMTSEDGKELVPLFGPGFTGMKNIGNSCYLASVVQCLFSLVSFRDRFLLPFQSSSTTVVDNPADDLEVQMRKLADGLLSGQFSIPEKSPEDDKDYQVGIAPNMFKALIGKNHAEFGTMRQQDAFEFLIYLIDKLNKLQVPHGMHNPARALCFQTEQRTQCLGCKRVSYKITEQDSISVLVPARKVASLDATIKYESVSMTELFDKFTAEETVEYTCSLCASKAGASKRTLFKTFPDILVLNPGRFALENWVPTKLEIPIIVPDGEFDLDSYLTTGPNPGEEFMPEDDQSSSPALTADESEIDQLMAMGFPRNRAEKALLTTKAGTEAAMEWLFEHMEDPTIDEPFIGPSKTEVNGLHADDKIVEALMDMGFPQPRCQKAALNTGNSGVESAMDWLMQHMEDHDIDDPVVQEPITEADSRPAGSAELPAKYTSKAMACHKGSSIHAGHYVAFIKKEVDGKDDWVLFNDEKVVRGVDWEEASKTAYVYFFERSRMD